MADDLERRAILAAHDAVCPDHDGCGHAPTVWRDLTPGEQAIVEAWRDDRDALAEEVQRHQVGESYEVGYEHGLAAFAKANKRVGELETEILKMQEAARNTIDRAETAEAAIERVRALATGRLGFITAEDVLAAVDGAEATG